VAAPRFEMLTSNGGQGLSSKRYFFWRPVQMFRRYIAAVILLLFFFPCLKTGMAHSQATATSEQRKTSEPYTGDLSVFDSPGREDRLQINRVMDLLGIAPGKNVADVGAGSGWFTVRAARRVGAGGTVYAVDINPEA